MREFFNYHHSDCESLITDKGSGIISAIKQLKEDNIFTGQHLFDFYHITKNLKIVGGEKWSLIRKLYMVATQSEYFAIFDKLHEICSIEESS